MHDLMPFIILTLITCATPGAGVLNTVTNAFRYGRATAWQSPVGNAIGVGTMSVISATGLGAVIAARPFYRSAGGGRPFSHLARLEKLVRNGDQSRPH